MTRYNIVFIKPAGLIIVLFILSFSRANAQTGAEETKMHAYVKGLMSKMTLEEKIGQLNLVTGGNPTTLNRAYKTET